jgi:hypothetical protein
VVFYRVIPFECCDAFDLRANKQVNENEMYNKAGHLGGPLYFYLAVVLSVVVNA